MQKLVYLISFIASTFKFWGGKEELEYVILSPKEMTNNTDVKYITQFDQEEFELVGKGVTARKLVIKKSWFLCYVERKTWVLNLKKHLLIGKKNFKEHTEVTDKNISLINKIESLETSLRDLTEEKEQMDDFNSRFEKLIGAGIYLEHTNNIANIVRRERAEKISVLRSELPAQEQ